VAAIRPWETLKYRLGGEDWAITGVPCVHLPGGEVTGFLLHKESFGISSDGRPNVIYFTGDTILLKDELKKIRQEYHTVVVLANMGQAMAPKGGSPLQITLNGNDAVRMTQILDAEVPVPMHYESWTHFTEGAEPLGRALKGGGIIDKVKWLVPGDEQQIV
jgi:L-ascorbate metabolism protein UlaG (beta-lactamase superfamily)